MNNTIMHKTLLAIAIGAVTHSAFAADEKKEDTIVVQSTAGSDFKPGGDQLVPAFLDGQVANGGRMGMLGQQNAMDVPFNIISYTSKLVEDQQAKTIADVVANDAGVQFVQGYGNSAETFRIRGLKFDGDDMTFGGLSGVLPRQVVDAQMVDRIEIFKGANSLMNGAASSGVGGMINLEPKHAGDTPQAKVGVDYTSDSQIGTTLDAGRRYGDSDQFGARVNLVHREGETGIPNDRRRTTLLSTGLDYKGDRFRTSLDLGYQKKTFHGSPGCGAASTTSPIAGRPIPAWARSTRTKKGSTARRSCWIKAVTQRSAALIPTASAIPSAAWRAFAVISIPASSRTRSTLAILR